MIESRIVEFLDMSENLQNIEVYGRKGWLNLFSFMKVLISNKKFSFLTISILTLFFFLQIWLINITKINDTVDTGLIILNHIRSVLFIQEIVNDSSTYFIAIIINSVANGIYIFCIIYVFFSIKSEKFVIKLPIDYINFINIIYLKYFIGPLVQINLYFTNCDSNNINKFISVQCYSNKTHLIFMSLSLLNLVFSVVLTLIISIYSNEIGSITDSKILSRIDCNYEFYTNISKIIIFLLAYFVNTYTLSDSWIMAFRITLFLFSFFFYIYAEQNVLFLDKRINSINTYGWLLTSWFSLVIFLKQILSLKETSMFLICGFICLCLMKYYFQETLEEELLLETNIFDAKSIKEIESYRLKLMYLLSVRDNKNTTILKGILFKFEEIAKSDEAINEQYSKLVQDIYYRNKFKNNIISLYVYSMIYVIYSYHLEKSSFKYDVLLPFCYFLINRFKNYTYSIFLLSTFKSNSHKISYNKYLLMEEVQLFLVNKIVKNHSKDSIKNLEISSVILYNIYLDYFREKIYEVTCNTIEYFETIKSNTNTINNKLTENFLSLSEKVLELRKEIFKLFQKLTNINPFSDHVFGLFATFLKDITQDDISYRNEFKKYQNLKLSMIHERNNTYHLLFQDNSAILLVDSAINFGKILYFSPNFPQLFDYNSKEIVNFYIHDLVPPAIKDFHLKLIKNYLKYISIQNFFSQYKDVVLRMKNDLLSNILLYVKVIPNFSFGLILIVNLMKVKEEVNTIILDKSFKINCFTKSIVSNFSLEKSIINMFIFLFIPEFLKEIVYNNEEIGFENEEFKGYLYSYTYNPGVNPESFFKELTSICEKSIEYKKANDLINFDLKFKLLFSEIIKLNPKKHPIIGKVTINKLFGPNFIKLLINNDFISIQENSQHGNEKLLEPLRHNENKSIINIRNYDHNLEQEIKIRGSDHNSFQEEPKDEDQKLVDKEEVEEHKNGGVGFDSDRSLKSINSQDSASFYRLKNTILEKKEVAPIKMLRYLSFIFGISSIVLIIFSLQSTQTRFEGLKSFINQNIFYNHSKVYISGMYFTTLNMYMIKTNVYNYSRFSRFYDNFTLFCNDMMNQCIDKIQNDNIQRMNFTDNNFTSTKFEKNFTLTSNFASIFNSTFPSSMDDLVSILVTYGLNLNNNSYTYFTSPNIDNIANNIFTLSNTIINDDSFKGLSSSDKLTILQANYFQSFNILLIVALSILFVLMVIFIFYICSLFSLQSSYLGKIIKFKNSSFEKYVKNLDEYKKSLRNENNEEDDRIDDNENQKEEEEGGESVARKKLSMNNNGNNTSDKKKNEEDGGGRKKDSKELVEKDKNSNIKKIKKFSNSSLTKDKEKAMSKYFLKWNFFFCFKVIVIIILSGSFHLISALIDQYYLKAYLGYDELNITVQGIFTTNVLLYTQAKIEIASFVAYEIEKRNTENYIKQGYASSIIWRGINVTKNTDFSIYQYKLSIPDKTHYDTFQIVDSTFLNILQNQALYNESSNILNTLYYGNVCDALYGSDTSSMIYKNCMSFASSVLQKGLSKASNYLSTLIDTFYDQMNSVNNRNLNFSSLLYSSDSAYRQYENFIEIFLFKAFESTYQVLLDINNLEIVNTLNIYQILMILYICLSAVLFFFLLYLVYKSKNIFSKFINFIGIIPARYLIEDINLYKDILKLEQYIY